MRCTEECLWLKSVQSKACQACKTRRVQCILGGEPIVGKAKTEDGAEQGDGSPKTKKRKVVLKETIKESEVESEDEAEANAANQQFEAEWV